MTVYAVCAQAVTDPETGTTRRVVTSIVDVDETATSFPDLQTNLGLLAVPGDPAGIGLGWSFDGTDWSPPTAGSPIPVQDAKAQAAVNVAQAIAGLAGQIANGQADLATLQAIDTTQPLDPPTVVPVLIDTLEGVLALATGLWDLMCSLGQAPPRQSPVLPAPAPAPQLAER